MEKNDFLKDPVKHIDIKSFNSIEIIEAMKDMSFTARDTAKAAEIFDMMVRDEECTIILCIAGSTSAAGECDRQGCRKLEQCRSNCRDAHERRLRITDYGSRQLIWAAC